MLMMLANHDSVMNMVVLNSPIKCINSECWRDSKSFEANDFNCIAIIVISE